MALAKVPNLLRREVKVAPVADGHQTSATEESELLITNQLFIVPSTEEGKLEDSNAGIFQQNKSVQRDENIESREKIILVIVRGQHA